MDSWANSDKYLIMEMASDKLKKEWFHQNIPITIVLQAKHPTRGVTHLQKWNQLQGDLSGLSHLPFCQKFQWRQNLRKYTFLISPLSDYKTMFCLQILEMPNVSNSYFVKLSKKNISYWVLIHVCTTFCNLVQKISTSVVRILETYTFTDMQLRVHNWPMNDWKHISKCFTSKVLFSW